MTHPIVKYKSHARPIAYVHKVLIYYIIGKIFEKTHMKASPTAQNHIFDNGTMSTVEVGA